MSDADEQVSGARWAHRRDLAMGSFVDLLVWSENAEVLASWAIEEIGRLETTWSRFRPDSELSALNAAAGCGAVHVSSQLWSALALAESAHEETGGIFDPTVHGNLMVLGYDRTFSSGLSHSGIGRRPVAAPAPGFASVVLDAATRSVVVPKGCGVDLGGIGKGLAVDMIVTGLMERGATSVCVSMGGDLRVSGPGPDPDDAWFVPVEDPRSEARSFVFPLVDEALAQSSVLFRRWAIGADAVHHLIDPRTGRPSCSGIVGAVVTARETWRAETLAKAAIVAGVGDGMALLERAGVDGWLFHEDGTTTATVDVADVVWDDASHVDPVDPDLGHHRSP